MEHPLDNPAWHALIGPQASLATGSGLARRISPAHSFFTAIDAHADSRRVADDLRMLVGEGDRCVLVGHGIAPPPGFDEIGRGQALQMVLDDPDVMRRSANDILETNARRGAPLTPIELGVDDVRDMMALVEHAKPGPFLERTIELGTYLGVRVDGELVAMAGERLRPPGYVEISAVSTHASQRRRGLASVLVAAVADRALARGDIPFLHVVTSNVTAIAVYERLGFRTRRIVDFVAVAHSPSG